jgi:5-methylthioadenosine/S-adenosylhomocysteine deaminase
MSPGSPRCPATSCTAFEGAKALGLADRTGSLRKGKRADVIMVGTREVNIGPFTVLIDGRILKRNGKLTAIDVGKLMDEASAATQAIKQRANWK